uniref:3 beta-hydroxysteroid dehydrogenase/Delta 5-->4-isomerase type 2-like n=1 Tax=Saccoglossus kowalevskii TaxID=10224 RepID=A0ABM0ML74_SACKO|nr:PREDICTED: 3 beta-hydroxysteroid dehydrogenase/Delta 5-->4-isomerase type 2-like [Saccoglossus kowalevskii]
MWLFGAHVINLLMTRCEHIKEIISVDLLPFHWVKGLEPPANPESSIRLRHIICDLRKYSDVNKACQKNIDVVIHTAGFIDVGTGQDWNQLVDVNVKAVDNVIRACIANNIPYLVHTSSQDVAAGMDPLHNIGDDSVSIPTKFFYKYAETKFEGEQLVIHANNSLLLNEKRLLTVALRPCSIYGEGDNNIVTPALRVAYKMGGVLVRFGDQKVVFQYAYAGNIAWAHILAMQHLQHSDTLEQNKGTKTVESQPIAGKCFFIMDETPARNLFDNIKPYVEDRGIRISDVVVPFWIMYCVALFLEFITFILKPFTSLNYPLTRQVLYSMYVHHNFNYNGARKHLKYKPIFTPEEAMQRSLVYYRSIEINPHVT